MKETETLLDLVKRSNSKTYTQRHEIDYKRQDQRSSNKRLSDRKHYFRKKLGECRPYVWSGLFRRVQKD